ncbi:MAG: thioredoxin family protein [Paludibacteraceae bacterium]|jgi:small redox-active disulfide protein 2|nr:thioredoxin family protein [Paludibacteraceae bacterium]NCB46286.1 thioredoxin family protein [bacterium]
MEIKVLGTGCSSCKALYATVLQAVNELGVEADVVKEEDMMKIMAYNVMQLPALVINEKVVAKGKMSLQEVKEILNRKD